MPSDTGKAGGARTGETVSHYVLNDQPFQQASQKLLGQGFGLSWHDRATDGAVGKTPVPTNTRAKYTCPRCGLNAWAKPKIVLLCGTCRVTLRARRE